jgi:uncharacterized protein YjcR
LVMPGEPKPRHKLTEDKAWEVYQLTWYTDLPQKEIAAMYGISPGSVSNIKHGNNWGFEERWLAKVMRES